MSTNQTIIIKKIRKGGHGHHGGAWKVAYADFVTAMMAFFLLMWLLNATEAEKLAGLADYFAPTLGVQDNMGIGFRGGKVQISQGIGADVQTNKGIVFGGVPDGPVSKMPDQKRIEMDNVEYEKINVTFGHEQQRDEVEEDTPPSTASEFSEVSSSLKEHMSEITRDIGMEDQVDLVQTPQGLEIRIRDSEGNEMFEPRTAKMRQNVIILIERLARILNHMPNYISVTGHTNAIKLYGDGSYSNWELSTDRANTTRRILMRAGIPSEQVARVIGKSDNEPLEADNPLAASNNRISIILLRDAVMPRHKRTAPDEIFFHSEQGFVDSGETVEEKEEESEKDESIEQIINKLDAEEDF